MSEGAKKAIGAIIAAIIGGLFLLVSVGKIPFPFFDDQATATSYPTDTPYPTYEDVSPTTQSREIQVTEIESTSQPSPQETSTLEPIIVEKGDNPAGVTTSKRFDITLADGEAIVGQSWELITLQSSGQRIYSECVAYLFRGPGQYSFSIIAGYWYRYQNVTNPEVAESLLQGHVNSLVAQECPATVKVVRLPE